MPHSRTETEQDDYALRILSGCQYKVLRALVNRADSYGICYPGAPYLADATGYNLRHVQRALEVLEGYGVFLYRRRDAWDDETRRQLPNVMQLNPDYIRLNAAFEPEARELWDALIKKCGHDSVRLWSHTITNVSNQAPKPTPVEPTPVNQHQQPTPARASKAKDGADDYANQQSGATTARGRKAKNKNPDAETDQREAPNQRNAHSDQKSSVPPERAQYENPDSINTNLPDSAHEGLAAQIREFGIGMPLARGFVVTYGYKRAKMAFDQVKKMGGKAREPAAVFRSILQVRLTEDAALAYDRIFAKTKQS